jgi:c(7)-type cytochrome triheme protein
MQATTRLLMIDALVAFGAVAAEDNKPPGKLVFPSKVGDIPFDHPAHVKRDQGSCTTCHDKLWPQSAKVPLKSSAGCRTCHQAGGKAFDMKDNCKRRHPEDSGKPRA